MTNYNCIVVLGPTASGKTKLACSIAAALNGEVISADSRQVYKQLDIGTGKDLSEYTVNGKVIPYHLIGIKNPGGQYYLHEFMADCEEAFSEIRERKKIPVICGGTGLYLDALRKDFSFTQVKENFELRTQLEKKEKEELVEMLKKYPPEFTQHADTSSKKRLIRAMEVAVFLEENPGFIQTKNNPYQSYYIGIDISVEERRNKISKRLAERLNNGLIEEAESLIQQGLSHERLQELGLEYKFVSYYLLGKIDKQQLQEQLQTAIFQFAKRQMTWFRKMEKEGVKINWVPVNYDLKTVLSQLPKIT